MKNCPRFKICPIQSEILALKLEVQLFNSLIENNIKEIKEAKIEDQQDDSHCKFLMCFVNNLDEQCKFEKVPRSRKDTISWIFHQIFLALPTQKYSSFWPSAEMVRALLNENCKTVACQSTVFLNLVNNFIF